MTPEITPVDAIWIGVFLHLVCIPLAIYLTHRKPRP